MFCLRHSKCLASINVLMHDSLLFLSYKPRSIGGENEAQNEHDLITNHPVTRPDFYKGRSSISWLECDHSTTDCLATADEAGTVPHGLTCATVGISNTLRTSGSSLKQPFLWMLSMHYA